MHWDSRVLGAFWDFDQFPSSESLQRSFHSSCIVDNHMYIFGGEVINPNGKPEPTNSFIKYNLSSGEYSSLDTHLQLIQPSKRKQTHSTTVDLSAPSHSKRIRFSIPLDLQPSSMATAAQSLPPLSHHSMTYIELYSYSRPKRSYSQTDLLNPHAPPTESTDSCSRFLYIFGGQTDGLQPLNHLFRFNIDTKQCVQLATKGQIPSPRYGHTACKYGQKLYIFGGTNGDDYYNDLYVLDIENQSWIKAKTHGTAPSRRSGHSASVFGTNIYIFGGGNDQRMFNDIYTLDADTLSWSLVKPKSKFIPSQRIHHTSNFVANKLFVVGGTGRNTSEDQSLFTFDVDNYLWQTENAEINDHYPPSLYGHSAVVEDTKIWIFGGKTDDYHSINLYSLETDVKGIDPIVVPKSSLPEDLSTLVNDRDVSDIIFELANGSHFYAHKAIFAVRCPVLHKFCLKNPHADIIPLQSLISSPHSQCMASVLDDNIEITEDAFDMVMEYIYTDSLPDLANVEETVIRQVFALAHLFKLERLVTFFSTIETDSADYGLPPPTLQNDMLRLFDRAIEYLKELEISSKPKIPYSYSSCELDQAANNSGTEEDEDDPSDKSMDTHIGHELNSERSAETKTNVSTTDSFATGFTSEISAHLSKLERSLCDVTFHVDTVNVPAHRCVLIARSEYFRRLLITGDPKEPYKKHIEIENITKKIFILLLEFIYTGTTNVHFDIALELLIAAETFELDRLSLLCQQVLERKLRIHNACQFLKISDQYNLNHLRDSCEYFIVHHLTQVRKTSGYRSLDPQTRKELKDLRASMRGDGSFNDSLAESFGHSNQKQSKKKKKGTRFKKKHNSGCSGGKKKKSPKSNASDPRGTPRSAASTPSSTMYDGFSPLF